MSETDMNESKRRFFSGDTLQQALVQAANHFQLNPEELSYRSIEKRHGFLKTRRRVVIEVDPDAPRLPEGAPPAALPQRPTRAPVLAEPVETAYSARAQAAATATPGEPAAGSAGDEGPRSEEPERRPERQDRGPGPRGDRPGREDRGPRRDDRGPRRADRREGGPPRRERREGPRSEDRPERGPLREDASRVEPIEPAAPVRRPALAEAGPERDPTRAAEQAFHRSMERGLDREPDFGPELDLEDSLITLPERPRSVGERYPVASGPVAEAAQKGLDLLLGTANLRLSSRIYQGEGRLEVELTGEDADFCFDEEGEVLRAIEHLLPRLIRSLSGEAIPCRVDCESFHEIREEQLRSLAQRVAAEVRRRGRSRILEPMNPADRRIVHITLADDPGVETESEGDGYFKRIVVRPV